jgi:hypothetical protein
MDKRSDSTVLLAVTADRLKRALWLLHQRIPKVRSLAAEAHGSRAPVMRAIGRVIDLQTNPVKQPTQHDFFDLFTLSSTLLHGS